MEFMLLTALCASRPTYNEPCKLFGQVPWHVDIPRAVCPNFGRAGSDTDSGLLIPPKRIMRGLLSALRMEISSVSTCAPSMRA